VNLPTLEASFRCPDTPEGFVVRLFNLEEALDTDYRGSIMLVNEAEFEPKDFLGGDCEFVLSRGSSTVRRLYGIIDRLEWLGELDLLYHVRLRVVPAFTLLDRGRNTRIWQDKSVRDILSAVLEPALAAYGRTFEFGSSTRGSRIRDYCVQYRESDHAFVCRLLEEEGLAYDFVHDPDSGTEILTFRDANEQYFKLENLDGSNEVPLIEHDADLANVESLQSFGHVRELQITAFHRRDYDWKAPRRWLNESSGGVDHRSRTRRVYLHEDRRFTEDDLTERAADAIEAERAHDEVLDGRSNVSALAPGMRFVLTDASTELDREYLVTHVVHELTDTNVDGGTYTNTFSCLSFDVAHRPRQATPKPRVHGPHTATVVGDDEIHTDVHGRIQVQFHWEENPSHAAGASCWIRCAQSWSGPGWGAQFLPRRGMEVVVEFLEGNPDRPLVTGCVYNGVNEFPFVVPQHKTQSGWRTRSTPDNDGYNMLRFEDAVGNEEIHIHGQKDWTIVIENDKDQQVRHDEKLHVHHDRTKTVGNNERETIVQNRWINVGLTHTENIGVNMALNVGINQMETIGIARTLTVGQFLTTTVGKDMNTVVVENMSEGVGDSKNATVGVDSTLSVGKKFSINVGEEMSIVCGKSSIVMNKDGEITIRGVKIDSETEENTNIRGKLVKLNCAPD
jgi:type VI secretion system secreted protein VgrG